MNWIRRLPNCRTQEGGVVVKRGGCGRRIAAWVMIVTCMVGSCLGEEGAVAPVPPASDINPEALDVAVRASLACGAIYFLEESQTNYMGLVAEPIQRKKVIGYEEEKTFEVRYREDVISVPVYKYDYETYETYQRVGGESVGPRRLQKVTRRRVVGRKKVGEQKSTRLVQDNNGPIRRTHVQRSKPIYDKAPDIWTRDLLGLNALALHALLKAGISQENEDLKQLADTLARHVNDYGLPDGTWDLAWLTAAFSNMRGHPYEGAAKEAASKLLDGQITVGSARGMWGPISLNTKLLAAMMAYEERLNTELARRKAALKEQPNSRARQQRVDMAEQALSDMWDQYKLISQQGNRFQSVTALATLDGRSGDQITVMGLACYFYNQTLADMESTALALYGIRQAAENECLPEETWRPAAAGRMGAGQPLIPPERASSVLARAAAALAKRQGQTGGWDEGNIHQVATDFVKMGLPRLAAGDVLALASQRTPFSQACGYSGLVDAGVAVGLAKMLPKYGRNVSSAQTLLRTLMGDYLSDKISEDATGGHVVPYEFMGRVSGVHCAMGTSVEDDRELWSRMAYRVLDLQLPDGSWGKGRQAGNSSSVWAHKDTMLKYAHDEAQNDLPIRERKPYDRKVAWRKKPWHSYEFMATKVAATAYSMLFLADAVRPPIVGYVTQSTGGTMPPRVLTAAFQYLRKNEGVNVRMLRIQESTFLGQVLALPAMFLTDGSDLSSGRLGGVIRDYINSGGVVIVLMEDMAVSKSMETKLAGMASGGQVGNLPDSISFMAEFKGSRRPVLRGILNKKGRAMAVFVPVRGPKTAIQGTLSLNDAAQVTYLALKDRVTTELLDPGYPSHVEEDDKFLHRIVSLETLKHGGKLAEDEKLPEAPVPVEVMPGEKPKDPVPVEDEDPDALPPPPAVQDEKPKDDEVW